MSTTALPWILTGLSVSFTAAGHVLFKFYARTRKPLILLATALTFVGIPASSYFALKSLSLAQVYLCASAVPVLTTIAAKFLLEEPVNWRHFVGLLVIISGMILYLADSV